MISLENDTGTSCIKNTISNYRLPLSSTDSNLSIPAPNITYVFINSHKLYFVVNMTSILKEGTDDLRVAMVIQILDTNTSQEYYHWMVGFFINKVLQLSIIFLANITTSSGFKLFRLSLPCH